MRKGTRGGAGVAAREAADGRADASDLVYGLHAVREAAGYDPAGIEAVWVEHGRRDAKLKRLLDKLDRSGVPVRRVARKELDRMTGGAVHQGVAARYRGAAPRGEADLEEAVAAAATPLLLVLDQVQDPHNLGACLRTAAAAGALGVVASRDRAVGLTSAVHKSAAGALHHVYFFQVTNLARTLERLKEHGVVVVGAAGSAPLSCYEVDLTGGAALVVGGEERGMRRLTRERCDSVVAIPMAAGVESLNVSVAAGVLLFEAVRQRGLPL